MKVFIDNWGLLAIGILMIANGFFSTPPSEATISFGGIMVANGELSLFPLLSVVVLSHFVGTTIWYVLGRIKGVSLLLKIKSIKLVQNHPHIDNYIPTITMLNAINELFRTSGVKWICIFRFLPFVRSVISIPAGIAKVKPIQYVLYTLTGDIVWSGIWLSFGFFLGTEHKKGQTYIMAGLSVVLVILIITIGAKVKKWLRLQNEVM